ncbi:penicillin-binding protein activator [Xenorhabdus szentirmaii]|uniref:penicillin-binding protein activator n=1 Tax=Xenorhabdus szentirmaii TaxID=290112 RepID=UPI0019980C82|nr:MULTISPECIES: penicillin-binding protein activator [unclassified Xenorhabdus]MBD2790795.1 penicillin-binding protein activator [Xenorhabdus sp. CUL]MBD2804680.1 penicillin-binding protein activator [Xenorhabdus sp. ZM]
MLPSIFVRFKTGLVYTAVLSTMIIAGCTMLEQQGQPTYHPQDKISSEISHYQTIIDAAHNQPSLDVIRAYIALEQYEEKNPVAHQKNIDETWQLLTQLSPQQLNELVVNTNEYTLLGWLDLLNYYQTSNRDIEKLRSAINDWKIRYPNNPAAHSLPTELQQMLLTPSDNRTIIGLFLPLSGQAKVFGEAIRQGFLDAQKGTLPKTSLPAPVALTDPSDNSSTNSSSSTNYSNDAANLSDTESESNALSDQDQPAPSIKSSVNDTPVNDQVIKVYDTNSESLINLLTQAEQDGVTLIVGPLLKPNVEQLSQIDIPLNILALNELDTPKPQPNICYFSLSPEDEAKNAAEHIWQQQKHNPLLLIPRTEFGNRVATAFAQEWQKLGGQAVLQQTFGTPLEMRQSMNRGIGIRMTGTPVLPTTSASGPVDAVYIVATADELTVIKPMIDMAISSRKRPDLYASSRSNKFGASPDFRLEMDGMQFSDIPLLSGINPPLMQQAAKKFANDYSLMRLYAMGIDAWSLANQFTQMQHNMDFRLNGESGELSITDNCTILRQLPWMQFSHGRVLFQNRTDNAGSDNMGSDNTNSDNTDNVAGPGDTDNANE